MQKDKLFAEARFSASVLRDASDRFRTLLGPTVSFESQHLLVEHDDAEWTYDSVEEFIADYRRFQRGAKYALRGGQFALTVLVQSRMTRVAVEAPTRPAIEALFEVFENNLDAARLPPLEALDREITVFVGHGNSLLWRDLKDHLQDKHGIKVVAYESGARAGHTVRDILEQLVDESSFAVLVMTADDAQADGSMHARQNVVHEVGLFQGRLGFARAVVLVETGTTVFSNMHGVQRIDFARGNIRETFGEVVATVRREFAK
jgi:predicted nucleotide-binding protein